MKDPELTRRNFALLAGTAAATQIPLPGATALSARDVANRLQTSLGGEWPASGPDGFKAGDPNTPVKGIATTAMATLDVLQRASKADTNLVLTYEPTFFGRRMARRPRPPRGVALVRALPLTTRCTRPRRSSSRRTVWLCFGCATTGRPQGERDGHRSCRTRSAGRKYRVKNDDALYDIPATTRKHAVALIRSKLNLRGGLRAVGDRKARVRRVLLFPGVMTPATMWQRYSETDLIVAGEVREWENTHYAADMFTAGEKRALVTTGRVVSEEPGMRVCAEWLKTVVKEVPAKWIGVGDPYWRPAG